MDWSVFFRELVDFLPKRIPMYPAYRIGAIVFSIVIFIGFIIYKKDEKRRLKLANKVPSELISFGKFVYIFSVTGVALACGQLAFKSQFYLDNYAVNGKWMVYKNWGFIN